MRTCGLTYSGTFRRCPRPPRGGTSEQKSNFMGILSADAGYSYDFLNLGKHETRLGPIESVPRRSARKVQKLRIVTALH